MIGPRRIGSSKILFSLFSILVYIFSFVISPVVASLKLFSLNALVLLHNSSFDNYIFLLKQYIVEFHLFKHLLQLIDITKTKFHYVARHLFYKASFLRYKFLSIRDGWRHKQVDTHLAVIRQEQIRALNLLYNKIYAYRLCKAQHLNGHGGRHSSPVYILQIISLMKMIGYIILQLSISN